MFVKMDVRKLIALVADRRALWTDQRGLHVRQESKRLWDEIGNIMNCSGFIVRMKWQNLRDTFRKECTKVKRSRVAGVDYVPTWKHFRSMSFMLDAFDPESMQILPGNMRQFVGIGGGASNIADSRENSKAGPSNSAEWPHDNDQASLSIGNIVSLNDGSSNETGDASLHRIKSEPDLDLWEEEQSSSAVNVSNLLDDGQTTEHDEDYYFLISLLPHLRDVPKRRKLAVRQKLQQVIIDEMNDSI